MSPAMKEDSVCFLTVSFHILRIRLWGHSLAVSPPTPRLPTLQDLSEATCLLSTTRDLGWALTCLGVLGPILSPREPCPEPWPLPRYLGPCVVAGVAPHG